MEENCGIFGIYSHSMDAARLVYAGLWSLQHRGQESSGISVSDGTSIRTHKGMGLVARVYSEKDFAFLQGKIAIGHNRYSTSGGSKPEYNQPVIKEHGVLALAHNGNLPSTTKLERFLTQKGIDFAGFNDSELIHEAIRYYLLCGKTLEEAIEASYPLFTGVFCLVVMTHDKIAAVRDRVGIRPFSIGKLNGDIVFASETCAFSTIGAKFLRDVQPGEMVVVDKKGLHSYSLAKGQQQLDVFEFIYFSRPDSILLGKSVNEVRKELGRTLAKEHVIAADVVIPVPDSAIPAAIGYSQESGILFDMGFIKNRYIHRTFIQPAQYVREHHVDLKLNPLPEVIAGKDIIVIDDSIVRGTTSKKIVTMLRRTGAKKIHLLISSPPVTHPDFYGIDLPHQKDLIAANKTLDEITTFIGADSVGYLSYAGLINAVGVPETMLSTTYFTGKYAVDIGERAEEMSLAAQVL